MYPQKREVLTMGSLVQCSFILYFPMVPYFEKQSCFPKAASYLKAGCRPDPRRSFLADWYLNGSDARS